MARARVYTGLIYTTQTGRQPAFAGGTGGAGGPGDTSGRADGWYWLGLAAATRLRDDDFRFWDRGHPHPENSTSASNLAFQESCMLLDGSRRLRWVSTHCSNPRHFICHFASQPPRGLCHKRGDDCSSRGARRKRKKKKKKKEKEEKGRGRKGKRGQLGPVS